jgi:serine/threonine protein kinase
VTEEQQQRVVAGRYTVIRELGRGGMGVVWLAEDRTIGRQVAIKELLLPPGIAPRERQVFEERVLREARTAGRLSDPSIVTVHDVVQEDGATYIVMELIEAENLSEVIRQHGPMPVEQVLKIAEQVLIALQTAHAAGIVHRDVKPSNVMIAANGRVKLTDFGIAQSTEDPRLTTSGTLVGSPTYISPERLLGKDASPASDLWALGATLFFAVEGYGAYDRQTTAASIQAIMNERAQLRVVPHGPLADLIMGLLNPDPDVRLNAGQAHYLIDQARTQTPPRPGRASAAYPGPVLSTPPAGFHQAAPQPTPPPSPLSPSPSQPGSTRVLTESKSRKAILIAAAAVVLVAAVATILAVSGVFRSSTTQDSAGGATPGIAPAGPGSAAGGGVQHAQPSTFGPGGTITSDEFTDYAGEGCYEGGNATLKEAKCEDPHDVEVYGTVDLTGDDDSYPDKVTLEAKADEGCREKFADITPKSQVIQGSLVPTQGAWERGKHAAQCVVRAAANARLTGSVAGN